MAQKNQLYYGDNYEVLQRYIKDESVDLIYLDPPFNSYRIDHPDTSSALGSLNADKFFTLLA